jgi:hypothetical protein
VFKEMPDNLISIIVPAILTGIDRDIISGGTGVLRKNHITKKAITPPSAAAYITLSIEDCIKSD